MRLLARKCLITAIDWNYNSLAITWCRIGFPELATLAAQKGIEIAKATKDPEHLLGQLQDLLDDAKRYTSSTGDKQMTPETYEKWKRFVCLPLPRAPTGLKKKPQY